MIKQIVRRENNDCTSDVSLSVHPVIQRIYQSRGVYHPGQLDYSLRNLLPFEDLKEIDRAVTLLVQAMRLQHTIVVVGDFDADGATSTALVIRALRMMGHECITYLVPNRFEYGYGLTAEIVAVAAKMQPDLIITVDNGIASVEGVSAAADLGISVLITDHHLPGAQLPSAAAIVNPNQVGDDFASKALAGVGTVFYLMLALRSALRKQGWFSSQALPDPNLAELLDLVALGTVADVVPLDYNNRIMVSQGLARIRAGRCHVGINALIEVAKRDQGNIQSSDLAFALGPRLNAAGRLDDMSIGIECLLTDDLQEARALAAQLDDLNRVRREIEAEMKQKALHIVDSLTHMPQSDRLSANEQYAYCLYDENWHQGVIGILASRIKELYNRPVIAFANAEQCDAQGHELLKGSARSISGLHIRDALDQLAAQQPELLSKFGGHAMAAGLSLRKKDLEPFRQHFNQVVKTQLKTLDVTATLYSDGELSEDDIGLELAEAIQCAGPWGQAFPEPLFDGEFRLKEKRLIGEKHLKMQLSCAENGRLIDAIAFNQTDCTWPAGCSRLRLAYRLGVNDYQGYKRAQILVEHLECL